MLDIVIPVLNEEEILKEKGDYFTSLKSKAHLIFADGGSCDRTVELAAHHGNVVSSACGRGIQKNVGARSGKSERILFLHVDTTINPQYISYIDRMLQDGTIGGCFSLAIDDSGCMFRFYEKVINARARIFHIFDGDLGFFIKRDIFERVGGFDDLAYMEDLLFGKKLKGMGKMRVLHDCPIHASSRKWREKGFIRTFLSYTFAYIQLWTKTLKAVEVRKERERGSKS